MNIKRFGQINESIDNDLLLTKLNGSSNIEIDSKLDTKLMWDDTKDVDIDNIKSSISWKPQFEYTSSSIDDVYVTIKSVKLDLDYDVYVGEEVKPSDSGFLSFTFTDENSDISYEFENGKKFPIEPKGLEFSKKDDKFIVVVYF